MSEPSTPATPKKILIVRLGAMGDILHALPAALMLKRNFPEAKFGWVIEKRWKELLPWSYQGTPFPDTLHYVDTKHWRKNLTSPETRNQVLGGLKFLRDERYEVVVDFQGAIKSAVVAFASGADRRYGFADSWEKPASLFYAAPLRTTRKHVIERNIEMAMQVVGREHREYSGGVFTLRFDDLPADCRAEGELQRIGISGRFAILNPGAGWGAKQWPVERFAEVARTLGSEGIRCVVNYGPGEEPLAREVEQKADGHAIAATFTISQLIAVTRRASLFIGGDTGPMHLAALLQVPVVAIFGPTDPERTGPYGTKSITLRDPASVTSHKRIQTTEAGLLNITTEQVLQAARELLQLSKEGVRV